MFPDVVSPGAVPLGSLRALLDFIDRGVLVSELDGRIVMANLKGRECLASLGHPDYKEANLLADVLKTSPEALLEKIESGSREIQLEIVAGANKFLATIHRVPEQDWLLLQLDKSLVQSA